MSCCGACRFWQPAAAHVFVVGGTAAQRLVAEQRAEESGLCLVFHEQHPGACAWLRSASGPFWGSRPDLGCLTHADDGQECPAFERIDA
jgi:hypothetical protein